MRRLAIALLLIAGAGPSSAQDPVSSPEPAPLVSEASSGPVHATLTVRPARPLLGQEVSVRIDVRVDGARPGEPLQVVWPDVAGDLVSVLGKEVAEAVGALPSSDGTSLDTTLRLYDAGSFELPPLVIASGLPDDEERHSVELPGVTLEIASVLPEDESEPAVVPNRGSLEWDVPYVVADWMWVGLGTFVLVAVALAVFVVLRRRRRGGSGPPAPPPPPPHRRALAALDALIARRLPEQGLVDPYFVELSEILRGYVEDRFGLRAPEQTSEEFLATAASTPAGRRAITEAHRDLLRDFLTRADLVKFARDEPDPETCHHAAGSARAFIEETRAPETSPSPAQGQGSA